MILPFPSPTVRPVARPFTSLQSGPLLRSQETAIPALLGRSRRKTVINCPVGLLTGGSCYLQVLRYTALALGVFYGFTHQRSITQAQKAEAAKQEYEHKQKLIEQAKAEYAKAKQPAAAKADDGRE